MKDCEDFHYATFIGTGDIHASRIAAAILITSKFIVSVDLCGAFGVLQYTFRSPGDAAALRRFFQNPLRFAAPPTPEQPDFV